MALCTNQSLRDFLDKNAEDMMNEEDDKKKLQWSKQVMKGKLSQGEPKVQNGVTNLKKQNSQ